MLIIAILYKIVICHAFLSENYSEFFFFIAKNAELAVAKGEFYAEQFFFSTGNSKRQPKFGKAAVNKCLIVFLIPLFSCIQSVKKNNSNFKMKSLI